MCTLEGINNSVEITRNIYVFLLLNYAKFLQDIFMKINLLKSKIHRATVTTANLDYIGSISIDKNLMNAANIYDFEEVHVLNVTNGQRLVTYAIPAPKQSGEICINGAAAHLVSQGDLVIIASYASFNQEEINDHSPAIVHVDEKNKIVE
jgi:aspartate 1-decarboxylase